VELQATEHPLPLGRVTVSDTLVLVVRLPLVPVMVTAAAPAVAELLAVSFSVEVALPLAAGASEVGEREAVTPEGRPETVSDTTESKPSLLPTVMVLVPDAPCAIDRLVGESDTEKDGVPDDEPHKPPAPVQLPRSEVNRLLYVSGAFVVPSPVAVLLALG
jgi:hypothetical protein